MARLKTLKLGILNITIHPHSPDLYVELLQEVDRLGQAVQIWGHTSGTLGWMRPIPKRKPSEGLYGVLYKFLNIDPREPWLDLKKRRPLQTEEGDAIPQVPDHLKPNTKEVFFVFYPTCHRLFFDASLLSPGYAETLMNRLFQNSEIVKRFGQVDVTVESSQEVVDRILAIPALTKLEIVLKRPNQDDSGLAARILERLERQHVRRLTETLTAVRQEPLQPDAETVNLMKLAQSNGSIRADGWEEDRRVEESTLPHPRIEKDRYDPGLETFGQAIFRLSECVMDKILGG